MNIKSTERILTVFILLALLGLLYIVGYPIYKESLPSKVRFGVDKSCSTLPFYYALMDTTRNYFALEKVNAEFIDVEGDPLEGIKNDLYDVAVVPWYWLIISPSTDGDTVKAFCSLEIKSGKPLDAIIVPPKSKITKLRDLSGKRLGYLAREEYLINLIMANMVPESDLKNITYVPLQPGEVLSAFADGKVDALYLLDPYRAYMVYLGNTSLVNGLASAYIIPNIPYGAIVMRKNYVTSENRLAAIRVMTAVEAALSFLARNPEMAKDYLVAINAWPQESELTMKMRLPDYERLTEINIKSIENMQTDLVRRGIGTCGIKPSEFLFQKTDFVR